MFWFFLIILFLGFLFINISKNITRESNQEPKFTITSWYDLVYENKESLNCNISLTSNKEKQTLIVSLWDENNNQWSFRSESDYISFIWTVKDPNGNECIKNLSLSEETWSAFRSLYCLVDDIMDLKLNKLMIDKRINEQLSNIPLNKMLFPLWEHYHEINEMAVKISKREKNNFSLNITLTDKICISWNDSDSFRLTLKEKYIFFMNENNGEFRYINNFNNFMMNAPFYLTFPIHTNDSQARIPYRIR